MSDMTTGKATTTGPWTVAAVYDPSDELAEWRIESDDATLVLDQWRGDGDGRDVAERVATALNRDTEQAEHPDSCPGCGGSGWQGDDPDNPEPCTTRIGRVEIADVRELLDRFVASGMAEPEDAELLDRLFEASRVENG